ncbi:hypothetical protein ACFTAO_08760 [Paenibacillus rhizoplanae]
MRTDGSQCCMISRSAGRCSAIRLGAGLLIPLNPPAGGGQYVTLTDAGTLTASADEIYGWYVKESLNLVQEGKAPSACVPGMISRLLSVLRTEPSASLKRSPLPKHASSISNW